MSGSVIWLASYMKSGNTWLRLLLANLLSNEREAVSINEIDLSAYSATRRDDLEELTQVDTSLLSRAELDALRPLVAEAIAMESAGDAFLKLHDAYRRDADNQPILGKTARAALYVIRDPRDVAVSLSFFSNISVDDAIAQMNRGNWNGFAKFRRYTTQIPQPQLDWSSHAESWIDQHDVPIHVIRYEDMLANTVDTLRKAVDFLGLDAQQERLEHAARCSDFSVLQRQEKEIGFRERPPVGGEAAPFFRAGRAGAWRETLTAGQEKAITEAHHRVMTRFGYL